MVRCLAIHQWNRRSFRKRGHVLSSWEKSRLGKARKKQGGRELAKIERVHLASQRRSEFGSVEVNTHTEGKTGRSRNYRE